jgi:hypothetical protein
MKKAPEIGRLFLCGLFLSGIHYLAKFPSIKDLVDVVKIEASTMKLEATPT